jgi:predicted RNA-binding protein with PIN domain
MKWLVDGYNVIRRDPALRARERESLDTGRTALLHLLARVARGSGEEFVVVFDGARRGAGAAAPGQVQVVFSRPPQSADDVLVRLATQYRNGAAVVTSDRTVATAAQRAGCAVVGAEDFVSAVSAPASDEGGDDDAEDDDERGAPGRGNPHRISREARAAHRALRRLRPR